MDEQTWRTVEVVPIDIANNEEVAPGVSYIAVIQLLYTTSERLDEQVLVTGRMSPP